MTKLAQLEAAFVRLLNERGDFQELPSMAGANGVMFDCPKCGAHSVLCWDRTVAAGIAPGPGRWEMSGTSLHDLTLSPSVDLSRSGGACDWHGWVIDGDAA
jgi:hypothetical protein